MENVKLCISFVVYVTLVASTGAEDILADLNSSLDPAIPGELKISGTMVRVLHGTTHAALAAGVTELDEEPMEDETEPKMIELGGLQPEDFWPARQNIPYDISSRFREHEKRKIIQAMQDISERTFHCVGFKLRTDESDYIFFQRGFMCSASVGRRGGMQPVTLALGCIDPKGRIQHEILHVLGIFHEHQRPDRDEYVDVLTGNIVALTLDTFKKLPFMNTYNLSYDLNSVMHPGVNDYARDKSMPTILPKSSSRSSKMGQRNGLSDLDAKKLQIAYGCLINGSTAETTDSGANQPITRKPKIFDGNVDVYSKSSSENQASHGQRMSAVNEPE